MAKKLVPYDEKKLHFTIVLTGKLIKQLRERGNYNILIRKLLDDYFSSSTKKD